MTPQPYDLRLSKEWMATMVENSQRPGEGNLAFVSAMQALLEKHPFTLSVHDDPALKDRQLLACDIGDPEAQQILVATSHADVVGVENQSWTHDPWKLHEEDGIWYGRGTCDTHGTGVSMLLAGLSDRVRSTLDEARKKVTLLFTYDEEATTAELSMRGARLAIGSLGNEKIIDAPYFIAGEPTEIDGQITPMRGHKGRFLAHYDIAAPRAGHASQAAQNALMAGSEIMHQISRYGRTMRYGSQADQDASIFHPPFTTTQVTAAEVKRSDYSTTPSHARFTLDMRTLPFVHELRVNEIIDLITSTSLPEGEKVSLTVEKNAAGSMTDADSPIVRLAEQASGTTAQGFNGGNEGRVFRNEGGMEGVTIGPGELQFAHMPDERIRIASIVRGAEVYADIFCRSVHLPHS